MTTDEAVLALLQERHTASSAQIGAALDLQERTVRRRLRRLIKDGYVFAPERGRYRITAAGAAVMAGAEPPALAVDDSPAVMEATPRDALDRWLRRS